MALHLCGFLEDQDAADASVNVAALIDQSISVSGDNLTVPSLNHLVCVAAGVGSGGDETALLDAPSLRQLTRQWVTPINGGNDGDVVPANPICYQDLRFTPRRLVTGENLQAVIDSNTSAAASQWVLAWLSDAPIQPVTTGEQFTVRYSGTTTVTAQAWSTVTITFADELPYGNYAIVGLSGTGATAVATRVVAPAAAWRAGVLAGAAAEQAGGYNIFRNGKMGIMGEFNTNQPPYLEYLCNAADSAQSGVLDLIKLS
jgi:hypothetical protein